MSADSFLSSQVPLETHHMSSPTFAAEARLSQQFDLRSLLWFTLLVALSLVTDRFSDFFPFFTAPALAAWEAGHTPHASFFKLSLRNVLALYVCFLGFGAVGYGLLAGENPTGWFGTTGFMFSVFAPDNQHLYSFDNEADQEFLFGLFGRARFDNACFRYELGLCAATATISSFSLAPRVRPAAYLVCWGMISMVIFPLFVCWTGHPKLVWLRYEEFTDHFGATAVFALGGWSAFAGMLVYSRENGDSNAESLPFSGSSSLLSAGGLVLLWSLWKDHEPFHSAFGLFHVDNRRDWTSPANWATVAGLVGGAAGSLLTLRRFHSHLVLHGGLAGLIVSTATRTPVDSVCFGVFGLAAGLLVAGTSLLLHRKGIPNPAGILSVFALGGVLGAISAGWFESGTPYGISTRNLPRQLKGTGLAFLWSFGASLLVYYVAGIVANWFATIPTKKPTCSSPDV